MSETSTQPKAGDTWSISDSSSSTGLLTSPPYPHQPATLTSSGRHSWDSWYQSSRVVIRVDPRVWVRSVRRDCRSREDCWDSRLLAVGRAVVVAVRGAGGGYMEEEYSEGLVTLIGLVSGDWLLGIVWQVSRCVDACVLLVFALSWVLVRPTSFSMNGGILARALATVSSHLARCMLRRCGSWWRLFSCKMEPVCRAPNSSRRRDAASVSRQQSTVCRCLPKAYRKYRKKEYNSESEPELKVEAFPIIPQST